MKDFVFYNPVKIIFKENIIENTPLYLKDFGKKVLLITGNKSFKKSGNYDKLKKSLNDNEFVCFELDKVMSNPELGKVYEGIKLAKNENVDFILACGGGSVIDAAKAIAIGVKNDIDVWDCFLGKKQPPKALPIAVILTVAATGSEMNPISVITNEKEKKKIGLRNEIMYPKISFLDPALTLTLPVEYTVYSGIDIIAHALEGYFTSDDYDIPLQDGFVETVVKTVFNSLDVLVENPYNLNERKNMMWASTVALNGFLTAGIGKYNFENHVIGHALSAHYNLIHGVTLSIVMPAWMKVNKDKYHTKFLKLGRNVFNIYEKDDKKCIEKTIRQIENCFKKYNSPVRLGELGIKSIDKAIINDIMETAKLRNIDFEYKRVEEILKRAL